MSATSYAKTLTDLLKANAIDTGNDLKGDLVEAEAYAAQVMTELTQARLEPTYQDALTSARDDVALKYAGLAVDEADKVDQRVTGIVFGVLGVAAQALAKV
jgi:hypothetical protein